MAAPSDPSSSVRCLTTRNAMSLPGPGLVQPARSFTERPVHRHDARAREPDRDCGSCRCRIGRSRTSAPVSVPLPRCDGTRRTDSGRTLELPNSAGGPSSTCAADDRPGTRNRRTSRRARFARRRKRRLTTSSGPSRWRPNCGGSASATEIQQSPAGVAHSQSRSCTVPELWPAGIDGRADLERGHETHGEHGRENHLLEHAVLLVEGRSWKASASRSQSAGVGPKGLSARKYLELLASRSYAGRKIRQCR